MKTGRRIIDVLLGLLAIVALTIAIPNLFGVKTMAVLSGSMEPSIHTGSMVFIVPTDPRNIRPGDVISYVLNQRGTVSTHRVAEVDAENGRFVTKGDANTMNDPTPVLFNNVIGTVRVSIPLLGYALGFVLTTQGKIVTGTVIVALVLLIALLGSENEKKKAHADRVKIGVRQILRSTGTKHVYSRKKRYVPRCSIRTRTQ